MLTVVTKTIMKMISLNPWFQDYLGGTSKDVTKEEFVAFIKKATDKKTPEYRQLYFFLLKCFQEGDVHKVMLYSINGTISLSSLILLQ